MRSLETKRILRMTGALFLPAALGALATRSTSADHHCFSATHPPMAVSAEEREALDRGEMILIDTIEIEDHSWPRVCTYKYIRADPETSIAIFTDYARQVDYIPRVIHSAVVPSTADSSIKHVAYVIDLPLARDEVDTMREEVRRLAGASAGYVLAWHALTSSGTNAIDGSATFVPWRNDSTGRNGTLMIYEQAVDPKSWVTRIWFIKRRGIAAVRDATDAIATQIEKEVATRPVSLTANIAEFRRTLARAP